MKANLKKYLAIYTLSIKDSITYRNEMMVWAILEATPVFTTMILWLTIFSERAQIGGFNQQTIISYFLIGHIFSQLTASHFEEYAVTQIQRGEYNKYFIKPFSVKLYHTIGQLGWRVMTIFSSVLPVITIALLSVGNFFPPISITNLLFLPFFYFLSYFFESTISLMIIAMGFIFEQAKSFRHAKWMLGWIFSGSMIPLELMPKWLSNLSSFLPFQYGFHVPVQLVLGRIPISDLPSILLKGCIWLIVFYLAMSLLWKKNLKKYSAVGG
ncbi:ABC transporter permease [Pseudomonadota bacterium]